MRIQSITDVYCFLCSIKLLQWGEQQSFVLHPQCVCKVKGFEIIDKIVLRIFLMNDDEWWDLDDGWGGFGGLTQILGILKIE